MVNTIKVLLADDHDVFRRTLATFLEQVTGVEVVGEAVNGNEAIAMADRQRPDVILLDLNMPHKNGYEASRTIKRQNPAAKVFIISTNDEEIYRKVAELNLADGYFPKNSLKKKILELVGQLIAARETQSIAA